MEFTITQLLIFNVYNILSLDVENHCSVCRLCGTSVKHSYHTHFGTYSNELKAFITKHLDEVPKDSDCICKSHLIEAKRYILKDNYIPKWRNEPPSTCMTQKRCSHPDCSTPHEKVTTVSFANEAQIQDILGITTEKNLFCKYHYQVVYRTFRKKSSAPCAACGATPLWDTQFTRHCPDYRIIIEHMRTAIGTEMVLAPLDVICSTCYKLHLHIVNETINNYKHTSNDSDLKMLLDELKKRKKIQQVTEH